MMRAMPYNTQAKGVEIEVSNIIPQISNPNPKGKSLLHQPSICEAQDSELTKFKCNNKTLKASSSSVESEATSTLDTTRHNSPNSPTSTSTLSSSFNTNNINNNNNSSINNNCGNSDNNPGVADPTAGSASRVGVGLEEWESMFPNGDGALLPWLMGETAAVDDDIGVGFKHLLQSSLPLDDYDSNPGLGVVEQASSFETLPPFPLPPVSGLEGPHLGYNAKFCNNLSNSSSGFVDCKVTSNGLSSNCNTLGSIPTGLNFPHLQQLDVGIEKSHVFNPHLVMNQQQIQSVGNPSLLMSPLGGHNQLEQHMFQPQAKRHNPGVVLDPSLILKNQFVEQGQDLLLRKQQQAMGFVHQHFDQKPMMVPKQNHHQLYPMPVHQQQQQQLQEHAVKEQLFKAADLIQTGNFSLAEEILARLNHHLSLPAKPLFRAALYVKEALQMILLMSNPVASGPPSKTLTPFDVVHKMNAYKIFSEVSPITQFVNFTCAQAILEALDDADAIHIIDFDIGCGAQWASLIQELPSRKKGSSSLKITALASPSTSHPFELSLIRENLMQFASEVGVSFELQVVNLDSFDPTSPSMPNISTSEDEAIAVSIPTWALSSRPLFFPSILRFIKQRSPKIIVSLDKGFDRFDVPFPQHLIHSLESCTNFLDSLDGLNVASDIMNKIEKYFIQPKVENTVLGRILAPDKMPHWKNLFASAGLIPMQFSNFTETQADYVVKRTPGRGFHVEKRQASLVLSWQHRELVVASAWRC